ncbi:MAG: hypothetical protein FJ248_03235 [Nitrospira sp.]|nr:hypothetical protein [Nitrospira sp.]
MNSSQLAAFLRIQAGCVRLIAVYCLLSGASCGYQFRVEGAGPTIGGSKPSPQADVLRLKIVNFENKTSVPNIELKYIGYARREFAVGSGTRVVSDGEPADLILKGTVNAAGGGGALSFSLQGTFESRATASVSVTVEEVKTGKKIWTQAATASAEYFLTNDLQFNQVLETRAIEQAGRLAAQDLATRFQNFLDLRGRQAPAAGPSAPPTGTGGDRTVAPNASGKTP